ncbi:DUF222 domain-containing protein [Frankia sp. Cppng1_Ct_nod]|uniref:DUF222 domain-containing protein n=1 Tax=Frankia sp. Cppng1_Ct_nod TaxID=2897162 RepID=UPI00104185BB|nr:DUF222 domain-containing protein [Frankia sp. Cppng1_Ct_nod]
MFEENGRAAGAVRADVGVTVTPGSDHAQPKSVDVEGLDADSCLTLMVRAARQRAYWDAVMVRAQDRFTRLRPAAAGSGRGFCEFAADEVAAELAVSPTAAAGQLDLAHTLTGRLPATVDALAAGTIDLLRARALAEATGALSHAQASQVEQRILTGGGRASHARFRDALRRTVLAVDPAGAAARHRHARRDRQVHLRPVEDGMAELWALLPAVEAQAAYQRIDGLARRSSGPGDSRGIDERRADILTDLLLGHDRGRVRIEIAVTVPATTLLGLTDTPGELAGYGPIPAALARALAEHATWRRILTDPADGRLREVGRRRFPSPALARHIQTRDRTCRFPGCAKPARSCDLGLLCRHHHRLKHENSWTLHQPTPGHFTWTSPEKRTYHITPEPDATPCDESKPHSPEDDPPPY